MTDTPGSGSPGATSSPATPDPTATPPAKPAPLSTPVPTGPGPTAAPAATKARPAKASAGKTSAEAAAATSPGASTTGSGGSASNPTDPVVITLLQDIRARLDDVLLAIHGGPPDADRIKFVKEDLTAASDGWSVVRSALDTAVARLELRSKAAPPPGSLVLTDGLRSLSAIAAIAEQEQLWLADAVDHHVDGGARLTSADVRHREVERFFTAHELLQDIRQGLEGAVPPLVSADLASVAQVTKATCEHGIQPMGGAC